MRVTQVSLCLSAVQWKLSSYDLDPPTVLTKKVLLLWRWSRPRVILGKGRGFTPTLCSPWACGGVLSLQSTQLWLGLFPCPIPFGQGAPLADWEQLSSISRSLDVAIMGNGLFHPSCGIPSPPPRRMHGHGKFLSGHRPGSQPPTGVLPLYKHIYIVYTCDFRPE